jgi:alpha-glucosidase (family GH31 glycosyl hydrolase)
MHYVPILDVGVAMRSWGDYSAYTEGLEKNVFITIKDNETLVATVWPNEAAFPDWFAANTTQWW